MGGAAGHHLGRVLRVRVGSAVVAFDGAGCEAIGTVVALDDAGVWLELGPPAVAEAAGGPRLTLAPALLKGDKLADVVRMGTELGVTAFRPVVTRRCDARALGPARRARLARIASEAARQSGRARVPELHDPVPLAALRWSGGAVVADPTAVAAWCDAPEVLGEDLTAVSGPEGGLTPDEVASLAALGARPVRLGPSVLRAETAPVAMAAAWRLAVDA